MKNIERLTKLALLPAAIALATNADALQLNGVASSAEPKVSKIEFQFDEQAQSPKGFMLQNPPRLVLDFHNSALNKAIKKSQPGKGMIERINIANNKEKVRATIRLSDTGQYVTETHGNKLIVTLLPDEQTALANAAKNDKAWLDRVAKIMDKPRSTATAPAKKQPAKTLSRPVKKLPEVKPVQNRPVASRNVVRPAAPTRPVQNARPAAPLPVVHQPVQQIHKHHAPSLRLVGNVDFRRDEKGNGSIIVNLPDNRVSFEEKQAGNSLYVTLKGVNTRQRSQTYDVVDFATPVNNITVERQGADTRVRVIVRGEYDYVTRIVGNQLIIQVNKVEKKTTAEDLRKKQKIYKGDKLTLNFQDIEVRSVLQLLADFTDKNIVVSDTVNGSITLRLKDVPWDQAMDIVLRSKGLGMRENGSVIWVAPEAELTARENRELEQLQKQKTLEPLITEYMPVNFAKASELVSLIRSSAGKDNASLLSDRGSISVDTRTNTILVHDTVDHVEDIRDMIKKLDVPVRQVSIESRIVIANDEFTKELGSKFGVTALKGFDGDSGIATTSGTALATDSIVGDAAGNLSSGGTVFPVGVPGLDDRLNVNLGASASTGSFGFSILSKDYLVDLELSALQAESKGEIISTPRVVTTNQTKAIIEQGVEIPFLQASSSGATNVAFKKAVLSLEVTPQITPEDHVIMDLKVNQDTVGSVYSGVPSINTREVQTTVLVDNGQTLVLGGVHEETNANNVEKVPVLGDLPVVGNIFKRTRKDNNKRELLIFVTPKILD